MNRTNKLSFGLRIFLLLALVGTGFACTPKADDVQEPIKAEETAKSEPGKKKQAPHKKTETNDEAKNKDEDVDNVKEAFQYTGEKMEKGFKKSGKEIKKFFVGDE